MNVYVESNFVLEVAFNQEQAESCRAVLELAARGELRLVLPALSIAEPIHAFVRRERGRKRVAEELKQQLSQLRRSNAFRDRAPAFEDVASWLLSTLGAERTDLQRVLDELLGLAGGGAAGPAGAPKRDGG